MIAFTPRPDLTGLSLGDDERAGNGKIVRLERVLVFGRGGAGKSTFARRLGRSTGLPVVELDERFWQGGSRAMPHQQWVRVQRELAAPRQWILDGDLGPYDLPTPRLERADTVFVLDYSLLRCGWQSLRRGRERLDYWIWVLGYRRRSLPIVVNAISSIALGAEVHVFRTPREAGRFLGQLPATADSKKADR